MEVGDTQITLALALTMGGGAIFAALIASLIEVMKRPFASITSGHEAQWSFFFSALVVVLAFVDQHTYTLDKGFLAFVAWIGIAKLAGVAYDTTVAVKTKIAGG